MYECPLCYCDVEEQNTYLLPNCRHKFCKTCLTMQFQQKINDQQIDSSDFKCPQCLKLFDPEIMQNFAPKELYNKYCECALKFNKIFGLKDYEILVNCLNEKCTEKYVIWKGAEYATCPACKKKFCRKCFLEFHEGISCEQQKERVNQGDLYEYKKMKEQCNVCRCPHCNCVCEKISGCNYMYCICKGNFCFLCDCKLIEADHFNHFQNNDPFKSPCRIWKNNRWEDPTDEKDIKQKLELKALQDKKEPIVQQVVQQVQQQEVQQINKYPCPNCGSVDPQVSQLVVDDKFVYCKSMKCNEHCYCLKCKREFTLLNLGDHFAMQYDCKL